MWGVLSPAGLPKNITALVNAEIKKGMDAPGMKTGYEKFGELIRMARVKTQEGMVVVV